MGLPGGMPPPPMPVVPGEESKTEDVPSNVDAAEFKPDPNGESKLFSDQVNNAVLQ